MALAPLSGDGWRWLGVVVPILRVPSVTLTSLATFSGPGGRALSFGAFATCRLATSPSSFLRLPTCSFDGDGQDDCGVVIAPKAGPSPDVTPTLTVMGTANPATSYDMTARVGTASGGYAKP